MKKAITFFIIILIFLNGLNAQSPAISMITVEGEIIDANGASVANHLVVVATDTIIQNNVTYVDIDTVYTNSNGFYSSTLSLPSASTQGLIHAFTSDCNGTIVHAVGYYYPSSMLINIDFLICANSTNPCNSLDVNVVTTCISPNVLGGTGSAIANITGGAPPYVVEWNTGGLGNVIDNLPIGSYCATVVDSDGCVADDCDDVTFCGLFCEANYTVVNDPPGSNTYYFNDNSSTNPANQIISWNWDFGDGTISTDQNPTHSYQGTLSGSGSYLVCLTIESFSPTGSVCVDTYCDTLNSTVLPVFCDITNLEVQTDSCWSFFEVQTTPSQGDILEYQWSFGDGTNESTNVPFVDHTYAQDGIYQTTVTIITVDSCVSTASLLVDINDCLSGNIGYCEAEFYSMPDMANYMNYYFFDISSTNLGQIMSWDWDLGDGTTSTDQNPMHTYQQTGDYLVCLTITIASMNGFCVNSYCDTLTVTGNGTMPCQADFIAYHDTLISPNNSPYSYHFLDLSMGAATGWHWDFGDGATANTQSPTHIYTSLGTYQVCLSIWDNNMCQSLFCDSINVDTTNMLVTPQFSYANIGNNTVLFNNTTTISGNLLRTQTTNLFYLWDFGDGTTSTMENPIHTYLDNGDYSVCLTAIEETTLSGDFVCEPNIMVNMQENNFREQTTLYPNPVKNKLFIKSDSGIEFEVFNIYGKIVVNKIISETGEAMLDVSNLAPGYYGIKINYLVNNKTENYKFIKVD